jgi:hypothetical protein
MFLDDGRVVRGESFVGMRDEEEEVKIWEERKFLSWERETTSDRAKGHKGIPERAVLVNE